MQDRTAHPPVSPATQDQNCDARLFADIQALAVRIGPRNSWHDEALQQAADYCDASLRRIGYTPLIQTYEARKNTFANLAVEIPGTTRKHEIVVVGAHYDTHKNSPGANDNGSAIAALLELARHFAAVRPLRTLRLVAFANEESPFTRTRHMGESGLRAHVS
jgi:acetylornithine deacetylase/succinyl-diaminopimelate desuccinylase-like protein